ncbi:MAG: 50S ribosomal protein L11 methyltransferase [Opitutae bacterium]|nr:50S ribosomal protein L11 methyltransferase [Opitutae bacterium]
MSLIEIKAEIASNAVEAADTVLLELGVEGWSVYEDSIARQAWVLGVFTDAEAAAARWAELAPLLTAAEVTVLGAPVSRALADQDWKESYKAHFKAWQFGRLHWVPEWERVNYRVPEGDAVLWLDPGMAFGTGNHESTRLCCERLVACAERLGVNAKSAENKLRVIDAGCGSGILALSAALLGFADIVGFDNDPEAVRISQENAAFNRLEGRVQFYVGDLVSGLAGRAGDVVLANIQADVLQRFARELTGAVAPGGTLVLSGILAIEQRKVIDAFSAVEPKWRVESRVLGEWCDVQLQRPA